MGWGVISFIFWAPPLIWKAIEHSSLLDKSIDMCFIFLRLIAWEEFPDKESVTDLFEIRGWGRGSIYFFVIYEPNYPYRCYILSFMKIGQLIRKLRIWGGAWGVISFISRAPPLIWMSIGLSSLLEKSIDMCLNFLRLIAYEEFPDKESITDLFEIGGWGRGSIYFFIAYEPNYPYRCYILSFMKIRRLIRKLRTGDEVFKYSKRRIFWCLNMSFNF